MPKTFSIVVPVYQNQENLPDTVPRLLGLREKLDGYDLELIFVDDGSRDRSLQILKDFAARHPDTIKIVKLTRNFGQNPAIQAGLRHARGECVGIISADLQDPHDLFVDMVKEWERGALFVMGERNARDENWAHKLISGVYWKLVRRYAVPDLPGTGYDFCLLDRKIVEDVNRINEKNSPIFVLICWLGYAPVRFPITRKIRIQGKSQWNLRRKLKLAVDTFIGFSYLPARFITAMALATAAASIVYLLYIFTVWFSTHATPPGWMTVVGLLVLLGSMILFSLGIVCEYLLRILDEARKRPPYVVEAVIAPTNTGHEV